MKTLTEQFITVLKALDKYVTKNDNRVEKLENRIKKLETLLDKNNKSD